MLNNSRLNGVTICNTTMQSFNGSFGTGIFVNSNSASNFGKVQFNKFINITLPQNIDF